MNKASKSMYINGAWVQGSHTFNVLNPADGSEFMLCADGSQEDAKMAIDAAQNAFKTWSGLPFHMRASYLLKVAEVLEGMKSNLAHALIREGGAWFGKAMFESSYVPEVFRAAAAHTYDSIGEILPSQYGKLSMAVRRPLGVISVISPWNFPLLLSSRGIAFALAAGNTIVLKPSEETPYSGGLVLAEAFGTAGVPPGVLNVITCSRENVTAVGDELIVNPIVKGISFTGSTKIGRMIGEKAGGLLKKHCLELGGKDALIICEDADMDRAVSAATFGSFMHQGQICMSVEKILVHQSIMGEFIEKFVEKTAQLKVGDPSKDNANIIGPIINARQVATIKRQIEEAVEQGAKIEFGGGIQGNFVEPTILTQVTPNMSVFTDETFGPVAAVLGFDSDEEAISMANAGPYGLSSGVITRDERRGLDIASQIESGMCHINCSSVNDEPHAPFGGSKFSGVGRHGGRWAMEAFTETRWITLERGGRKFPPGF